MCNQTVDAIVVITLLIVYILILIEYIKNKCHFVWFGIIIYGNKCRIVKSHSSFELCKSMIRKDLEMMVSVALQEGCSISQYTNMGCIDSKGVPYKFWQDSFDEMFSVNENTKAKLVKILSMPNFSVEIKNTNGKVVECFSTTLFKIPTNKVSE